MNDRCCRPGWVGLGNRAQNKSSRYFLGDMNGKDVTTNDKIHGGGVVRMNNQSEIMKYRPSRARGKLGEV